MTWRRGPRDEAGQSSGEYVGVVAFVAALAVALFSVTGVAAASGVGVAKTALCTIGTPLGLGPCDDVDADDVLTSMTPEELATVGDYVALGDSYSSGEGADDYLEGTNSDDATKESLNDLNGWLPGDPHNNICRRSSTPTRRRSTAPSTSKATTCSPRAAAVSSRTTTRTTPRATRARARSATTSPTTPAW